MPFIPFQPLCLHWLFITKKEPLVLNLPSTHSLAQLVTNGWALVSMVFAYMLLWLVWQPRWGLEFLPLSGGINNLFGYQSNTVLLVITLTIVAAFVISAITGLMKGIRVLSDINIRIFIILAIFIFVFGPTGSILIQSFKSLGLYFQNLPEFSLVSVLHPDDPWPKSWTSFNWANWLAWAPITALFLGRLSYGYTVKQFMVVNWVLPSIFGMIWMSIFSGTAIDMQVNQGIGLGKLLEAAGPESIIYRVFEELPWSNLIAVVFLFHRFSILCHRSRLEYRSHGRNKLNRNFARSTFASNFY